MNDFEEIRKAGMLVFFNIDSLNRTLAIKYRTKQHIFDRLKPHTFGILKPQNV